MQSKENDGLVLETPDELFDAQFAVDTYGNEIGNSLSIKLGTSEAPLELDSSEGPRVVRALEKAIHHPFYEDVREKSAQMLISYQESLK